jgi:hypothetical protein
MKQKAWLYALAAGGSLATGCILPVSTGAPLPATTVGKGRFGGAISGEAPTLDLIADNDNASTGTNDPIAYGAAPAAALTFTLSYGVTDDTDIEVAGEGALYYFILPLPTGGSVGLRHHIDAGDSFDLGIAAKIGQVGSTASVTDENGNKTESGAGATYGALQAVVQTKRGPIRPLLALNIMPARITRSPSDEPSFEFKGVASSLTAGIMFVGRAVQIGPYIAATNFYSDRFDNSGWFVSGGISLAVRPDRNREPPPPPPAPMPMYAPPSGPVDPMPPPPMAPAPMPAPAPTPEPAPPPPPAPTTTPM